jgi:hypothetical protein
VTATSISFQQSGNVSKESFVAANVGTTVRFKFSTELGSTVLFVKNLPGEIRTHDPILRYAEKIPLDHAARASNDFLFPDKSSSF